MTMALSSTREDKFRSIIENSFDMIALLDLNACYLYCNNSYRWILGYNPNEMIGRCALELTHPDERAEWVQLLNDALKDASIVQLIEQQRWVRRIRHQDGSYRWVEHRFRFLFDENGAPAQILLNAQDITEYRQMEEKLHQQLEELQRWQRVTLGREGRVMELKREVNQLLAEAGKPARYTSVEEE